MATRKSNKRKSISISENQQNSTQTLDILGNLPSEKFQNICVYLTPDDLFKIINGIPNWRYLLNDEYFWKMKCKIDNYFYPIGETSKSPFYKKFSDNFDHWQATYFYNQAINYNWKNNIFQEIPLPSVEPLHQLHYFDDEVLIVCTPNDNIKIFNSSTGIVEKCFSIAISGYILYITKQNNILVCITELYGLIWNIKTEKVLKRLVWERTVSLVRKFCIYQNLVAFSILYNANRIFEPNLLHPGDLITLNLKSNVVRKIQGDFTDMWLFKNVAVLLQEGSIKVVSLIDISSKTLTCCSDNRHVVKKISVKNEYVIGLCIFENDVHISVWHIETSQLVKSTTIDIPCTNPLNWEFFEFFDIIFLDHNKLVYSFCENLENEHTVRGLDYMKGEQIFSINFYNDSSLREVFPILKAWNNNIILSISTSNDCDYEYIRMFCPNTGKLIRTLKFFWIENLFSGTSTFTPTKMLQIKSNAESGRNILNILNFAK